MEFEENEIVLVVEDFLMAKGMQFVKLCNENNDRVARG